MRLPFLIVMLLTMLGAGVQARVVPERYGVQIAPADSTRLAQQALRSADSLVRAVSAPAGAAPVYAIAQRRSHTDRTPDFYLLLSMVLLLGGIRSSDPKYFLSLLRTFRTPSGSARHARESLQTAVLPNLLMNVFFALTGAAYLFYLLRLYAPVPTGLSPGLLLACLSGGVLAIYLLKYAAMRFTGWAFRVEEVTDQYLFNVFLINKIIGMALLPFVVMMAFLPAEWAGPLVVVSLVVTGLLILNRYTRSWSVFGSFFQYSRFHFFTYLCASEILPLALLLKLLLRNWGW